MTDTSPAVAKLQSEWRSLPDLDRARAVYAIKHSGVSTRQIALHLNVSESLLRHLLQALQAPIEDTLLAHKRNTSTNELVRRAKAAGIRRSSMHREALEFERPGIDPRMQDDLQLAGSGGRSGILRRTNRRGSSTDTCHRRREKDASQRRGTAGHANRDDHSTMPAR